MYGMLRRHSVEKGLSQIRNPIHHDSRQEAHHRQHHRGANQCKGALSVHIPGHAIVLRLKLVVPVLLHKQRDKQL